MTMTYEQIRSDPRQLSFFGEEHTRELMEFYLKVDYAQVLNYATLHNISFSKALKVYNKASE